MKTVKRILALAGAALLIASLALMTSCNDKKVQENIPFEFPYPEHIELSWWYDYDDTYFGDAFTGLEEHPFMKRMEEKTNVSISFSFPTAATDLGSARGELEAVMAAGETPDMVTHGYYCVTLEGNTIDSAIDEEIYLPLNEYIDVQMTNFNKLRDENSLVNKWITTQQGNILYIPKLSGLLNFGKEKNTSGLVIRKDYLDELQLPVPVTIDDWYNTLSQFKNALGVEIPLVIGSMLYAPSMDHDVFITCYDQRYELYIDKDTGKIAYGAAEDGVKNYVMQMNKWVSEGIAVITDSTKEARLNGQVGAWVAGAEVIMQYKAEANDADYELVACPDPVVNVGDKITYHGNNSKIGDKNQNSIFLSWNCSQPAIAAKWIDQMFSDENFMEASYGIENEDYTVDAEGNVTLTKTKEVYSRENGARYGIAQNSFLDSLWCDPEVVEKFAYDGAALAAVEVWSTATGENCIPSCAIQFTDEEADTLAGLNKFWDLQQGNLKAFINGNPEAGGKDITEWDDYVAAMMDAGLEEYIATYQAAYDRYLAS